jgi:hypothetical protein
MAQELAAGAGKGSTPYARGRDGDPGLAQAVERFAVAWNDAHRMRAQELPLLSHQEAALRSSGQALDKARPGAMKDLLAALKYDPEVRGAMTGLQGSARSGKLVAGIEREALVRQDPTRVAERALQARKIEAERSADRDRGRSR